MKDPKSENFEDVLRQHKQMVSLYEGMTSMPAIAKLVDINTQFFVEIFYTRSLWITGFHW